MRGLFKRMYMYFKGKEMWNAKMSEHLEITITSMPQKEDARKSLSSFIRHGLLEVSGKGKVIELEVLVYD